MRFLFKSVYFLIFIWFLRNLRARLSTTKAGYAVRVTECRCRGAEIGEDMPEPDDGSRRKYTFALVRNVGKGYRYWFLFRCSEHVAVEISTEFVRQNPELMGHMALHRYPCHCDFESIAGALGWTAHRKLVSSMQHICQDYVKTHPGTRSDELPC